MSVSMNKITMLEERINKILDIVKQLQETNVKLAGENDKLHKELNEKMEKLSYIERDYKNIKEEFNRINSNQETIKNKIEDMINNLDKIEAGTNAESEELQPDIKESEDSGEDEMPALEINEKEEEIFETEDDLEIEDSEEEEIKDVISDKIINEKEELPDDMTTGEESKQEEKKDDDDFKLGEGW